MKKIILPLIVIAASGAYVWSQQGRIAAENVMGGDASLDATASPDTTPAVPVPAAQVSVSKAPDVPALQAAPAKTSEAIPDLPGPRAAITPAVEQQVTPGAAPDAASPGVALPRRTLALPAATQATVDAATAIPIPRPRPQAVEPTRPTITLAAATIAADQPSGQYQDGSFKGSAANAYYGLVQVQANVQGGHLVSVKILQYPNDRNTSRYINAQALPMLKREAIQAQSANVDFVSGATFTSQAYVQSLAGALDQAKQ